MGERFDTTVITYGLTGVFTNVRWIGLETGYLVLLLTVITVVVAGAYLLSGRPLPTRDPLREPA